MASRKQKLRQRWPWLSNKHTDDSRDKQNNEMRTNDLSRYVCPPFFLGSQPTNTSVQIILWDPQALTTNPPPSWPCVYRRAQNGPIYLGSFRPQTARVPNSARISWRKSGEYFPKTDLILRQIDVDMPDNRMSGGET